MRALLAETPLECLGSAEPRAAPRCIILVHEPPAVDAIAVLERMRGPKRLPPAPVVVLTSEDSGAFRRSALAAGAMEVLSPTAPDPGTLREAVEDAYVRFAVVRQAAQDPADARSRLTALRHQVADSPGPRSHPAPPGAHERPRVEPFAARLIENLFAFVGVLDPSGTLLDANSAPLEAAGLGINDVRGKSFWDCFWWNYSDDPRQRVREACRRAAEGETVRYDAVVRMAGDTRMTIDFQIAPLCDDGGSVAYLIASAVDITERFRVQQELLQAEERRRVASEVARVGTFEWDIVANVHRWSPELERLHGLEPGTFDGTHEAWTRCIHPEDRPRAEASVLTALETGSLQSELRIVLPDGTVRWLETRALVRRDETGRARSMVGANVDVTERHLAERALAESERRFRHLFETNLLGILFWDLEGRIHGANDELLRIVGYSRAELETGAIDWVQMTPAEYKAQDQAAVEELRTTGKHQPVEKEFIRKDDTRTWVLVGSAMLDSERGVGVAFVLDISRAKASEVALRASEAQAREAAERAVRERQLLDAVLEAAQAGIVVTDAEGKFLMSNSAHALLWGPAALSANTKEYADRKGWWVEDSDRRGQRLEPHEWALARALRGETVRDDIIDIEPFDEPGTRRTLVNSAAPVLDSEGGIRGAVVAQMDISARVTAEAERRDSEARFRAIADNIAQLAWMTDDTGYIHWYNRRWFEFTGTTLDETRGWGWQQVHHPDYLPSVVERFREHLSSGEPWEDLFPLRRHDGEYRWFLSRAVPLRDASSRIVSWFGTNTDVTAQREAEEALREADRRKDEFIAVLAHELRNPLAPVRNAVEILRILGPAEPRLQRARDIIDRQVTHMARLIDDLLDVSRLARGKVAPVKTPCDLAAIAARSADDYRSTFDAKGVKLNIASGPEALWVEGDHVRLCQMIGNLLHNACRFTDPGGSVDVCAEPDADRRAALVRVKDTGAGIDPALLSRLFDPFSQAEQDLARSKGGLGVGLALTKGLAELHGGDVHAESAGTGRGSTFTLRIPLSRAGRQPDDGDADVPSVGGTLRILVVEDNQDAAESLRDLLVLKGHRVELALDAAAALALAAEFVPDVVISDIGLPGALNGYTLCRRLREHPRLGRAYLIALSGYADAQARSVSREAGFDAHLAKPPNLDALDRLLREYGGG